MSTTTEGTGSEPMGPEKPIKLTQVVTPTKDQLAEMGVTLFQDLEAIVRTGEKTAKESAVKVKEALETERRKARDRVWKYVSALTDKNLAAIYKSYDPVKMVGNIPFEYVRYQIVQRFCERALGEAQSILQPFQAQDQT